MEPKITVKTNSQANFIAQLAAHVAAGLASNTMFNSSRVVQSRAIAEAAIDIAVEILTLSGAMITPKEFA